MKKTDVFSASGRSLRVTRCGRHGLLVQADALIFARSLRSEIADVVFVDPPFNLGKDYGVASRIERASRQEYATYMASVLREMTRVLRPGGTMFLYHTPFWASQLCGVMSETLTFRHWIAVAMKNGFVRGRRLYPAHYALLYFTKGRPRRFLRPRVQPQSCRWCGDYVKDYGGYRSIIEQNGINLSDIWDDLSPVRHASLKLRKANQLPRALTDRVVEIAGGAGALLVDPFVGTGTSLLSARSYRMRFVGNDLSARSVSISRERVAVRR